MTEATLPSQSALLRLWERSSRLDPRYLIAFLITLVLVAAQLRYHMIGGYERLAVALLTCTVTEALLSWFVRGKVVNLLSAYISGISLTLLIKPQGAALWPFVLGGFIAIASKYVIQYRNNHLWNPTNFAVTVLLLTAANRVSVLSHQWGNDLTTNLVIWCFGLVIAARVSAAHHPDVRCKLPRVEQREGSIPRTTGVTGNRSDHGPDVSAVHLLHDHRSAHRRARSSLADHRRGDHRVRGDGDPVRVGSRVADADRLLRRTGLPRAGDGGPDCKIHRPPAGELPVAFL